MVGRRHARAEHRLAVSLLWGQNIDVKQSFQRCLGTRLRYPQSSGIKGSRHDHMRELRVQSGGKPIRVFYAFDPRRTAILLIGGDKKGDNRFYERFVPFADRLYDDHLKELKEEGAI
ncbi:MAG: addiction module toxin RelE [Boseongicola sp. SB0664_bin_43]|uniref:Addiction module toxin RelE n=1 Tax=Boseongicola sp. SB0664_bin_43 TaxID=2604844 RepID=A0A6B0Y389_9RHOB|nr:addiction module toxin RelE [Boseongicola sp. SB0664_bin_43]MYK33455.1 addiction module toxin RelE [Boseongicola sp. SB0670_bin_30]